MEVVRWAKLALMLLVMVGECVAGLAPLETESLSV